MTDIYQSLPVSQKAKCLAHNKAKARFVRDNFLRERLNQQQQKLAMNVVKFSTLLTEQKLDEVRTAELRQFEKDMKQYCRVMAMKRNDCQQKNSQSGKINYFLEQIKRSTKVTLMKDKKDKKAKSQPKMDASFGLQTAKNNFNSIDANRQIIPLGNIKIKEAIFLQNEKTQPRHSLQLNGKRVSLHLLNLIQKLQEMQSIENIYHQKEKHFSKGQTEEDILVSTSFLKKENERLLTAKSGINRRNFKPMGNIAHQKPRQLQITKIQSCDKPNNIILHSSIKRKILHDDIKKRRKTQMASIRKNLERTWLKLDEGLPPVIRQLTPLNEIPHQRKNEKQTLRQKLSTFESPSKIFKLPKKYADKIRNDLSIST